MSALLADLVAGIHLAIVLFMVGGILLVLVGWPLRWRWIRNPWFRLTHLLIMTYIVINAARGELCFLTHWERDLRVEAGQVTGYRVDEQQISFVGRLLRRALYVEDVPQDTLHLVYFIVGGLVLVATLFVRPRRLRLPWRTSTDTGGPSDH